MANNCCVTPEPPAVLDGTTLTNATLTTPTIVNPAITGGTMTGTVIGTDCNGDPVTAGSALATCSTLPEGLPPTGAAGGDLGGTYPNPTVESSTNQDITTPTLRGEIITDSAASASILKLFTDAFAADTSLKDLILQALIDAAMADDDVLESLKACIIASINRCDGSSHAVGDSIPTCQEMTAAIEALRADLTP